MPLLLDSNSFLWALYETGRLGPEAKKLLKKTGAVYVSVASLWELAIKHAKGMLPYSPNELADGVGALGTILLPIKLTHLDNLRRTKLTHKDPFDTILISQSSVEGCVFLTADSQILKAKLAFVRDASK